LADDDVAVAFTPQQAREMTVAVAKLSAEAQELAAKAKASGATVPTNRALHEVKAWTGLIGRRGFWAAVALNRQAASPNTSSAAVRTVSRAPRSRRVRSSRTSRGAPSRSTDDDPLPLASRLEAVLLERGPLPAGELALTARRRKAVVLETLHTDSRFKQSGKRRASRWSVARFRSFNAVEAAERWDCDLETARELLFGIGGFLERGFVSSLNGNGRVVVSERGLAVSRAVTALDPAVVA
jgi:hypothetical protein